MKSYMGHFGDANTINSTGVLASDAAASVDAQAAAAEKALFTTASDIAEKSLNTTLDRAAQLARSEEVQLFIKENGLEPYLKDVTQDRVKNVLALAGLWYVGKTIKSPAGLAAIGALGIYVLYSNKDKLLGKIGDKISV